MADSAPMILPARRRGGDALGEQTGLKASQMRQEMRGLIATMKAGKPLPFGYDDFVSDYVSEYGDKDPLYTRMVDAEDRYKPKRRRARTVAAGD